MLQWHNGNDTNTNIDIFRHVSCDRANCLQKIHVTIGNVNVQCNLRGFAICMQILIGFILDINVGFKSTFMVFNNSYAKI